MYIIDLNQSAPIYMHQLFSLISRTNGKVITRLVSEEDIEFKFYCILDEAVTVYTRNGKSASFEEGFHYLHTYKLHISSLKEMQPIHLERFVQPDSQTFVVPEE